MQHNKHLVFNSYQRQDRAKRKAVESTVRDQAFGGHKGREVGGMKTDSNGGPQPGFLSAGVKLKKKIQKTDRGNVSLSSAKLRADVRDGVPRSNDRGGSNSNGKFEECKKKIRWGERKTLKRCRRGGSES